MKNSVWSRTEIRSLKCLCEETQYSTKPFNLNNYVPRAPSTIPCECCAILRQHVLKENEITVVGRITVYKNYETREACPPSNFVKTCKELRQLILLFSTKDTSRDFKLSQPIPLDNGFVLLLKLRASAVSKILSKYMCIYVFNLTLFLTLSGVTFLSTTTQYIVSCWKTKTIVSCCQSRNRHYLMLTDIRKHLC
jgi:hypothetical protein